MDLVGCGDRCICLWFELVVECVEVVVGVDVWVFVGELCVFEVFYFFEYYEAVVGAVLCEVVRAVYV